LLLWHLPHHQASSWLLLLLARPLALVVAAVLGLCLPWQQWLAGTRRAMAAVLLVLWEQCVVAVLRVAAAVLLWH
jgi:hypothetical protein